MERIEEFYDQDPEREWVRLESVCPTEFAVTLRALAEYLPPAPATVLDIGGGPGRYAIELAQRGYAVTLADLSVGLLDVGRRRAEEAGVKLAAIEHCNALELGRFADGAFDAVLLLGPLYHLQKEEDRRQAVREAARVLPPGGAIFAAFMNRYAWHLALARIAPQLLLTFKDRMDETLATGRLHPGDWTAAYFAHPSEIRPLMEGAGFETLAVMVADGLIKALDDRKDLDDATREAVIDLCYRLSKDPAVLGAGGHLLYAGRKL
jgi:S-adenosylmethionine-dependent methyltransferase